MISPKVLTTAAAIALVLAMAAPTKGSAQSPGGRFAASGGVRAGAPAARFGGGGGAPRTFSGGGSGFHPGSGSAPVARFNGGGGGGDWHGDHRHDHDGRGFIPGAVAGAVIGGAIASGGYGYYGGPGYYDAPAYYDDQYYDGGGVAVAPGGDDAVAWCMQTYRSYDPASGTYIGRDGLQHLCP